MSGETNKNKRVTYNSRSDAPTCSVCHVETAEEVGGSDASAGADPHDCVEHHRPRDVVLQARDEPHQRSHLLLSEIKDKQQ